MVAGLKPAQVEVKKKLHIIREIFKIIEGFEENVFVIAGIRAMAFIPSMLLSTVIYD